MRKHGNGLRSSGEKIIVQYALGTEDAPYSDQSILLGTDDTLVGTDLALVGVDNSGIGNLHHQRSGGPGNGQCGQIRTRRTT